MEQEHQTYRLIIGGEARSDDRSPRRHGSWAFRLESLSGGPCIVVEAGGSEPGTKGERLQLLSLVRGLEALDQPSNVQLVTDSRYVVRGLRYGLPRWAESDWRWECYGRMVPVKYEDLWKRVNRALRYHHLSISQYRVDASHAMQAARSPGQRSRSTLSRSEPSRRFTVDEQQSVSAGGQTRSAQRPVAQRRGPVPRPHFRIVRHNGRLSPQMSVADQDQN